MTPSVKAALSSKFLKVTAVVLGCILCLFLIATILLLTVLEPYAARYLKKQVVENTDGLYQLAFEDIEIDLFTTTLQLKQVHLYPDTNRYRQLKAGGDGAAMLFELEATQFRIERLDIIDAIFQKHLRMETLFLEKPEITLLMDGAAGSQQKKDTKAAAAISSLHIGELNITDASIRSKALTEKNTQLHALHQLSLLVHQLEADFGSKQEIHQQFKARDVALTADNYTFQSADSVYKAGIGQFTYASATEKLLLKNAVLTPNPTANEALDSDNAYASLFKLNAPELQITGLKLMEAFQHKALVLDQIIMEDYALEILESTGTKPDTAALARDQLYARASAYVEEVQVDEFIVAGARIAYFSQADAKNPVHEINRLSINLQELQLDSATLFTPKSNLPVQEISVSAEQYNFKDAKGPYRVQAGYMALSSKKKSLELNSILVNGDWDKNRELKQTGQAAAVLYSLDLSKITFREIDFMQAIKDQKLLISSVVLVSPGLSMRADPSISTLLPDNQDRGIYQRLSPLLKEILVDKITVQDASYSQYTGAPGTPAVQLLKEASLQVTSLKLDSLFFQQEALLLPVEELMLTAQNYQYRMPDNKQTFALNSLRYSTRTQVLNASGIDVAAKPASGNLFETATKDQPSQYDITAKTFSITGLDLVKAVNSGRLEVNEVVLRQPTIVLVQDRNISEAKNSDESLENSTESMFELFSPISAKSILLEEGTVTLHEKQDSVYRTQLLKQVSATLTGLNLTQNKVSELDNTLPFENLSLSAKDYTYQSLDSVYTITLDSLHYSSRQQQLRARLFRVAADKAIHEKIKAAATGEASRNLFDITARNFSMSGFDIVDAYGTGRFNIAEMVLTEPEVIILQDQNVPEEPEDIAEESARAKAGNSETSIEKDDDSAAALDQVAEIVEGFRVERIRVERGRFQFNILEDTVERSQLLEQVSLTLNQLRLVSMEANDPLNMFAISDLDVLIKDYSFLTPDSLYVFSVDEIRSSLATQSLRIKNIRLTPEFDKETFQEQLSYAADRYDLNVPEILLKGTNLSLLFNQQRIVATDMIIVKPEADIYRDNRLERDPDKTPPTLQRMLRQAGLYLKLDSVTVQEGKIIYSEIAPNGTAPGVISLEHMNIAFTNVTNDSLLIQDNSIATARLETMLMGESKLVADFIFHLDHPEDLYTYEGSMQPMKFSEFNPLTEDYMFVALKSGLIEQTNFSVIANEHMSTGQMNFLYKDLKISLIDKKNPDNRGFKYKAGTWLVNNLIVKSNNPGGLGGFSKGDISVDRHYGKSVFNHMSQSMLSGIISSLLPGLVETVVYKFTDLP